MPFPHLKFSTFIIALGLSVSAQAAPLTVSANDLSGLSRMDSSQFDEVYFNPDATTSGISLGNVSLGIENRSERQQFGTRDLEQLRSNFEDQLDAQIGFGNLIMDVTLTELIPNIVLNQNGVRTSRYHRSTGAGRASMEAVFRDADTGEIVLVIVDERRGLPLSHNRHIQTRLIWGDATDILEAWAAELPGVL